MRCDIHILGSRSGYTTIAASPGISPDERRELEHLHFGDAGTKEAAERLRDEAAMSGSRLRSGRFAVSRMLPSDIIDDAERPTVEVVTLVLSADHYVDAVGVLPRLAADVGFWEQARTSVAHGIALDQFPPVASPRDGALLPILDLWLAVRASGGRRAGVLRPSDGPKLLELVSVLDPADRLELRWGIGMRSVSIRVDLCALAPEGSPHGMREVLRPTSGETWHCPRGMEYASVRVRGSASAFPPVREIEAMAATPVHTPTPAEQDDSDLPRHVPWKSPRSRRWTTARLTALGSSLLATCALVFSMIAQLRQPGTERGAADEATSEQGTATVQTTPAPIEPGSSEGRRGPKSKWGRPADSGDKQAPVGSDGGAVNGEGDGGTPTTSQESKLAAPAPADPATVESMPDPSSSSTTNEQRTHAPSDPAVTKIETLRNALQSLLDRFPSARDEDTWSPGAGSKARSITNDWIEQTVRNSVAAAGTKYANGGPPLAAWEKAAREAANKAGWPEALAVEQSLRDRLPGIVRQFDEVLQENGAREGRKPHLGVDDLPEDERGFDSLSALWSGLSFLQPVQRPADEWLFDKKAAWENGSPAAMAAWWECLVLLEGIDRKLKGAFKTGWKTREWRGPNDDGHALDSVALADEIWGATPYPNLLTGSDARRTREWIEVRLEHMGWTKPRGAK